MTALREAAQQALDRLRLYYYGSGFAEDADCITALEAALAQQADKPQRPKCFEFALDFLGTPENGELLAYIEQLEARAALAQQAEPKGGGRLPPPLQAEPVAWYQKRGQEVLTSHPACWGREDEPWTPLYTAPPQRKPLSLTDLQEALVLTNLIDRDAIDDPEEYDEGSTLAQIDELHRIIKE